MQIYSFYCFALLRKPVCVTKTSRKCFLKCPPCVIEETEGVKNRNYHFACRLTSMCQSNVWDISKAIRCDAAGTETKIKHCLKSKYSDQKYNKKVNINHQDTEKIRVYDSPFYKLKQHHIMISRCEFFNLRSA